MKYNAKVTHSPMQTLKYFPSLQGIREPEIRKLCKIQVE